MSFRSPNTTLHWTTDDDNVLPVDIHTFTTLTHKGRGRETERKRDSNGLLTSTYSLVHCKTRLYREETQSIKEEGLVINSNLPLAEANPTQGLSTSTCFAPIRELRKTNKLCLSTFVNCFIPSLGSTMVYTTVTVGTSKVPGWANLFHFRNNCQKLLSSFLKIFKGEFESKDKFF